MRLGVGWVLAALGVGLFAEQAQAQTTEQRPALAVAAPPAPAASGYAPKFRRFGLYDYLGTAGLAGAYYLVEFTQHNAQSAVWSGPFGLDRPVRNWLVADSKHARDIAVDWADRFWYFSAVYPVADALVTPAIRTRGVEVSWNMTLMNFQSFMLVSLLIRMPHKWLGRTRPDSIGCASDPNYSVHCGHEGMFASFPGGHVAVSMTGAGLSCAHHLHGELYGSPLADGIACGTALAAAGVVGWLRMRSDSHWLSDQLVGTGLGLFSGYLAPTLLYYHPFWRKPAPTTGRASGVRIAALPWIDTQTLGAALTIID